MANVEISDLPNVLLPMDLTQTFFEVQTVEAGVDVSRRVSGDNLTFGISTGDLGDLDDVIITAASVGHTLYFDGTDWRNTPNILWTVGAAPEITFSDGVAGFGAIGMPSASEIRIRAGLTETFRGTIGQTQLFGGGNLRMTIESGAGEQVTVVAPAGAGNDALLRLQDGDGEFGHILKDGAGVFTIRNDEAGASLVLQVRNVADSAFETGVTIVSDGETILGFNGSDALTTDTIGALIRGSQAGDPAAGASQDTAIRLDNSAGTVAGKIGFPTTPGTTFKIANRVWGGVLEIEVTDGAGVADTAFSAVGGGAASVFFDGISVGRSVAAASGGLEANNTLTGAGFERVLTTADIGGAVALDDLTDVSITAPATGSLFYKSSGDWVNTARLAWTNSTGQLTIGENAFTGSATLNLNGTTAAAKTINFEEAGSFQARIYWLPSSNRFIFETNAGEPFYFQDGTNTPLIIDPGGAIQISHALELVARTVTQANGGFEVDAGYASGMNPVQTRGVGADMQGRTVDSNETRNDTTTLTDSAALSGFDLEPLATYRLDAVLSFISTVDTNGFRWAFDFNGEIADVDLFTGSWFSYQEAASADKPIEVGSTSTSQVKATFDTASVREKVVISLIIKTQSDYAAGTAIDLQWAQGTAIATDSVLEAGSWMTIVRTA